MWLAFWTGLAVGILLAIPAAWVWGRRSARRVKRLLARAQAAERLAELGQMTSGLAHEIKNPLSTVGLNIQLLEEDVAELDAHVENPRAREFLARGARRMDALSREVQRLRTILEDFLRFAGRMKLHAQPLEVEGLVTGLADFFEPQAQAQGVALRVQLDPGTPTIRADEALLKQALLNLMLNAVQAMADARADERDHGGANLLMIRAKRAEILGEPAVQIDVIDTGPGVDPAERSKVFEPYFSTKSGGTGLGLPTTRRIIEEHGGHIEVLSDTGQGTDFRLLLPVAGPGPAGDTSRNVPDTEPRPGPPASPPAA